MTFVIKTYLENVKLQHIFFNNIYVLFILPWTWCIFYLKKFISENIFISLKKLKVQMHAPSPQWLVKQNQKCKNFFTSTLP